jgi:hypothetical protein
VDTKFKKFNIYLLYKLMENHLTSMLNQGPIIKNYSPISSKGGARKRKSRRFKSRKNKTNKSRTRRRYH